MAFPSRSEARRWVVYAGWPHVRDSTGAMFETLTDRFDAVFARLRGRGRLSEADVDEALRRDPPGLAASRRQSPRGTRFRRAPSRTNWSGRPLAEPDPSQQVVKVVHDEMKRILGGETLRLTYAPGLRR